MKYLLDTNAVIALFRSDTGLTAQLRRHRPHEIGVSSIVMHELFYGAYKSQRREINVARVHELRFETLPFDSEDARHSGEIRAALGSAGELIGPYDVLIAGQARARSLTLVTDNLREFSRVSNLEIECWQ